MYQTFKNKNQFHFFKGIMENQMIELAENGIKVSINRNMIGAKVAEASGAI